MTGTGSLAYLRWHLRDSVPRAVAPVVIFLGVGGLPLWSLIGRQGLDAARTAGRFQDSLLQVYGQTMTLAMTLGALVVVSGIVSVDRERGHVRFLFAAPVSAWRHYLVRSIAGVTLFATAFLAVPIGFGAVVTPVPVLPVLQGALLLAFIYGSLTLLAGAITAKDGPVAIVLVVLSTVLQQLAKAEQLPRWAEVVAGFLPPLVLAGEVRGTWLAGADAAGGDLLLVLGYSLGMLVTALVVIHRAPLVR